MDALFPQQSSDSCRVCNEDVVDGRWSYCSERCRSIARSVQKMFVWEKVRKEVLRRDEHTCQRCGLERAVVKRAHWQTHERIRELQEPLRDRGEQDRWRMAGKYLKERYGMPIWGPSTFEVDHIHPISAGGHKFDERNLQTLCRRCHRAKTAEENTTDADDADTQGHRSIRLNSYLDGVSEAVDGGVER